MPATPVKVLLTANFERNLDEVERHLTAAENLDGFDRLLDLLSDHVIPTLERFPAIGRPISARRTGSAKVKAAGEQVARQVQRIVGAAEIREYILPDYLLLYAFAAAKVYLLAIRHHRQLSYDLHSRWIGA